MNFTSDPTLIAFSTLIGFGAAYAILDVANRTSANSGGLRYLWMTGGAFVVGLALWAMHFVGTFAIDFVGPARYSVPELLISFSAAITAALIGLVAVSGSSRSSRRPAWSGCCSACATRRHM